MATNKQNDKLNRLLSISSASSIRTPLPEFVNLRGGASQELYFINPSIAFGPVTPDGEKRLDGRFNEKIWADCKLKRLGPGKVK